MANTTIDKLNDAVNRELTIWSASATEKIKAEAVKSMKKLVDTTKQTAPKGNRKKGNYKSSIKSRKVYENDRALEMQWYVAAPNYRLTHLLENGHATRNGGRTKAYHFLSNATDAVIPEFEKNVEEAIKNG